MDSNLISGLIGIAGTLMGGGIAIIAQWKFIKHADRNETRRLLVTLKGDIDAALMKVFNAVKDVRFNNFCYHYRLWQNNNLGFQLPKGNIRDEYSVEKLRDIMLQSITPFQQSVMELRKFITQFDYYCSDDEIMKLFWQINNFNIDKYSYVSKLNTQEYLTIDGKEQILNTYSEVIKELQDDILIKLEIVIIKSINKYSKSKEKKLLQ